MGNPLSTSLEVAHKGVYGQPIGALVGQDQLGGVLSFAWSKLA